MSLIWRYLLVLTLGFWQGASLSQAQSMSERAPISYSESVANDPISQLQAKIDHGEAKLDFSQEHGYLPALLEALGIPESSQTLVFSKTSLQNRRITPRRPRALYFNDDVYVGWVQGGDILEVSAVDPQLGAVFYTLEQDGTGKPQFLRDQGNCLTCHDSSRTRNVPGFLVRSVFPDHTGQPHYGAGTFDIDQTSPFDVRWGGWYVTGTHGEMRHLGNQTFKKMPHRDQVDRDPGANLTSLEGLFSTRPYLEPTSDLIALMILEHQVLVHNLLTHANHETRSAIHYDRIMNEALGRDIETVSESTERRIASSGERLLQAMLFSGEFQLTSPVAGVSSFTEEFQAVGPQDSQGRSFRELDLTQRLFKYPCSYLICSESFDQLPEQMHQYLAHRLVQVLSGSDEDEAYQHLTEQDRINLLEMIQELKPEFWKLTETKTKSASEQGSVSE